MTSGLSHFIFKIASRCNLNCSYCYVYNKADTTWRARPAVMPDEVFTTALMRVRQYCEATDQQYVRIGFHGGEPCLVGSRTFDRWCARTFEALAGRSVEVSVQTNGTLLEERWIEVLKRHDVSVGLSLDGPQAVHDLVRYDHEGRGSYHRVARGLRLLAEGGVRHSVLSVIPFGVDPLSVHGHLVDLGCRTIIYLMPDHTHESIGSIRRQYGPTPCADFLIPVFDDWWFNRTLDLHIVDLWNVGRIVVGGPSLLETFGNPRPTYAFVEADGAIEGLDCLRSCLEGLAATGLNVASHGFSDLLESDSFHGAALRSGIPLPSGCRGCPEETTCAGGYLAHRYSSERGLDNPSVWCADILKLFGHIRSRLGVPVEETMRERVALLSRV